MIVFGKVALKFDLVECVVKAESGLGKTGRRSR